MDSFLINAGQMKEENWDAFDHRKIKIIND